MSDIKRYVCFYDTFMEAESQEDVNGEWVKYEDYAAATTWRPIETATWDVLSKNDRVILNGWNGSVRFANVVDVAGQLGFEDEYGVPLIDQYDGYTHWMPLPQPPTK